MSAAQWFVVIAAAFVIAYAGTVLTWRGEQYFRSIYRRNNIAWDDTELARWVADEERAWAEWESILRAVDNTPHVEPTPLYVETIVDNVRRHGGAA